MNLLFLKLTIVSDTPNLYSKSFELPSKSNLPLVLTTTHAFDAKSGKGKCPQPRGQQQDLGGARDCPLPHNHSPARAECLPTPSTDLPPWPNVHPIQDASAQMRCWRWREDTALRLKCTPHLMSDTGHTGPSWPHRLFPTPSPGLQLVSLCNGFSSDSLKLKSTSSLRQIVCPVSLPLWWHFAKIRDTLPKLEALPDLLSYSSTASDGADFIPPSQPPPLKFSFHGFSGSTHSVLGIFYLRLFLPASFCPFCAGSSPPLPSSHTHYTHTSPPVNDPRPPAPLTPQTTPTLSCSNPHVSGSAGAS